MNVKLLSYNNALCRVIIMCFSCFSAPWSESLTGWQELTAEHGVLKAKLTGIPRADNSSSVSYSVVIKIRRPTSNIAHVIIHDNDYQLSLPIITCA